MTVDSPRIGLGHGHHLCSISSLHSILFYTRPRGVVVGANGATGG